MAAHRRRVAFVTNRVPAYRFPIFAELVREFPDAIRIFTTLPPNASEAATGYSLPVTAVRGFNLRVKTVHPARGVVQEELLPLPVTLIRDLLGFRPDLIVSGEFGIRSLMALAAARLCGARFVLWSEEIEETALEKGRARTAIRKLLVRNASAFLPFGAPAARYLERQWGVPERRIYRCAQAIDNEVWRARAAALDRPDIRKRLGLEGRLFLAVGRLVKLKGFNFMLRAWALLPDPLKAGNRLAIVGGGEEEAGLKRLASELGISGVLFAGELSPSLLAEYYAAADVFVFPSLVDVWGMVVNEAMACGLPVLASKYAGAGQELVGGTGAGEMIDPTDTQAFSGALARWCTGDLDGMRRCARQAVNRCTHGMTVESIRRLIRGDTPPGTSGIGAP